MIGWLGHESTPVQQGTREPDCGTEATEDRLDEDEDEDEAKSSVMVVVKKGGDRGGKKSMGVAAAVRQVVGPSVQPQAKKVVSSSAVRLLENATTHRHSQSDTVERTASGTKVPSSRDDVAVCSVTTAAVRRLSEVDPLPGSTAAFLSPSRQAKRHSIRALSAVRILRYSYSMVRVSIVYDSVRPPAPPGS